MSLGRVLIVEDQAEIRQMMEHHLNLAQFEVASVDRAEAAPAQMEQFRPQVLVLDINLPGQDGLSLCQQLRKNHSLPILMVSALGEDTDRIVGLEVGADDYLAKPFNPRELVARVKAMMRRVRMTPSGVADQQEEVFQRGDLKLFVRDHRAELGGQEVVLTPIEFGLLRCLATRPGATLTRQELLDKVWGQEFIGDERTCDSHIRNLRAKLRQVRPSVHFIHSVWGVGYRFEL